MDEYSLRIMPISMRAVEAIGRMTKHHFADAATTAMKKDTERVIARSLELNADPLDPLLRLTVVEDYRHLYTNHT